MVKPGSVAGNTVAVTGGARGIGLAIATALHSMGAKVAIGDIDEAAVKDAGSRLGLRVCRGLDVTDRQSFTEFLDNVEDQLGPIDVLVNNAGLIAVGNAVDEDEAVSRRGARCQHLGRDAGYQAGRTTDVGPRSRSRHQHRLLG